MGRDANGVELQFARGRMESSEIRNEKLSAQFLIIYCLCYYDYYTLTRVNYYTKSH